MLSDRMDKLDKRILNTLLDDARLSYRQIAKKTGISTATAATRIRNMEKKGIIKQYSAILNYEKLDLILVGLFDLKLSVQEVCRLTNIPLKIGEEVLHRFNKSKHKRTLPPSIRARTL